MSLSTYKLEYEGLELLDEMKEIGLTVDDLYYRYYEIPNTISTTTINKYKNELLEIDADYCEKRHDFAVYDTITKNYYVNNAISIRMSKLIEALYNYRHNDKEYRMMPKEDKIMLSSIFVNDYMENKKYMIDSKSDISETRIENTKQQKNDKSYRVKYNRSADYIKISHQIRNYMNAIPTLFYIIDLLDRNDAGWIISGFDIWELGCMNKINKLDIMVDVNFRRLINVIANGKYKDKCTWIGSTHGIKKLEVKDGTFKTYLWVPSDHPRFSSGELKYATIFDASKLFYLDPLCSYVGSVYYNQCKKPGGLTGVHYEDLTSLNYALDVRIINTKKLCEIGDIEELKVDKCDEPELFEFLVNRKKEGYVFDELIVQWINDKINDADFSSNYVRYLTCRS